MTNFVRSSAMIGSARLRGTARRAKLESVVHMVVAGSGGFTVGIVSPVSGGIAVDHAV